MIFRLFLLMMAMTIIIFGCSREHSEKKTDVTSGDRIQPQEEIGELEGMNKLEPDHYNFRRTIWGMSSEEVRVSESANFWLQQDDYDLYIDTVKNKHCLIGYHFIRDTLVTARYVFVQEHTNKNDYIDDYMSLKKALAEKYGQPEEDHTIWRNNLYKDNREEWGFAVSYGHLRFLSRWLITDTEIRLILGGDNFDVYLEVEYHSRKHEQMSEDYKKQKASEEF